MGIKRFLAAFGIGGPSIDTVIEQPLVRPGDRLVGRVDLVGGEVEARIDEIAVALAARVEVEIGDHEGQTTMEFSRVAVSGPFTLAAGEQRRLPFEYPVSLQSPLTEVDGRPLPRAGLGLSTDVVIGGQPDKGDLDPVRVDPLPAQRAVLEAVDRLGFGLVKTDIEHGTLSGTRQEFPLYQEFEYRAAPRYAGRLNEMELSFVADDRGVDVVIEVDKRGGLFLESQDRFGRFRVEHDQAGADLTPVVAEQVDSLLRRRGLFG
ncbi:sporulation protein [Streptomonospora nanhaiensis]|uniref:Sporulation-control protein n=1 Tax=Streptomonospora nanhaiensis TaxID=1323731 RepID=A0A853BEQ0_9ACTN|nr:sporulation protein [Streptomonospora nanhaiensis]MBV2366255.1 sporulation protein [Streptomonospora nanhaiensis]NYI93823.1 sporulation-control protein [Streptomonospora nanhaiensis]